MRIDLKIEIEELRSKNVSCLDIYEDLLISRNVMFLNNRESLLLRLLFRVLRFC